VNQKIDEVFRLIPKKLVVGVRSYQRMNSLISNWGIVTDNLMALRGTGKFDDDLFTHVSPWNGDFGATLRNLEQDTSVRLTPTDLIFSMGLYQVKDSALNFEKSFELAKSILLTVIDNLPPITIRRFGIVGEYRAELNEKPSEFLFKKSKLKIPPNPAGFLLRYESRRFDDASKPPANLDVAAFDNIMFNFYDSAIDESPDPKSVNANIDVQRYYWPPLAKDFGSAMSKHFRYFKDETKAFKTNAKSHGLIAGEA